jgi:hypothetical protein
MKIETASAKKTSEPDFAQGGPRKVARPPRGKLEGGADLGARFTKAKG